MSKKINFAAPINSLSLGQVSVNIALELWKKNVDVALYPLDKNVNLNAYNVPNEFKNWIANSVKQRYVKLDSNNPTLRLWHIAGSEYRLSRKQVLYTFHELDQPTPAEKSIVKAQDHTVFSSSFSSKIFSKNGCANTSNFGLGFDSDILNSSKPSMPKEITHWILVGKWEFRKNTEKIIKLWVKRYGNNMSHFLTLCVTNPFYKPEFQNQVYAAAFGAKKPANINILGYLEKNSEVAQVYQSADIDLSGLSSAEGWGLPSFNCSALGKWSIVSNCTSHLDWATKENSILVNPIGKHQCYDGVFFHPNQEFNQGNFYTISDESIDAAMQIAEAKAKTPNPDGEKLQKDFTYEKLTDYLLGKLF